MYMFKSSSAYPRSLLTLETLLDTPPPHLSPLTMSQRAKPSKHEQAGNTPATNENAAKSHDEGQNHAEKTTDSATQPISNGLRKSARLTEEREAIVEAAMVAQQAEIAKTSRADSDKDDESSQGYENSLASSKSPHLSLIFPSSRKTNLMVRFV